MNRFKSTHVVELVVFALCAIVIAWWVWPNEAQTKAKAKAEAELTQQINKVCEGVTVETWGSKAYCKSQVKYQLLPYSGVKPCTIGGIPMFCLDKEDELTIWRSSGRIFYFRLEHTNNIRKHITYFSKSDS